MERRGREEPSRIEKVAQFLAVAIVAIGAGITFAERIQKLSRDPYNVVQNLLTRLAAVENQLRHAQRMNILEPVTQQRVRREVTESATVPFHCVVLANSSPFSIREEAKKEAGRLTELHQVDASLSRAEQALHNCGCH